MRLSPRKDEIKAVIDILEDDSFENADKMARALIKQVAEQLAEREWYALAHREGPGGMVLFWGPLSSEGEVAKFGEKAALGGQNFSVKLNSTGSMLARMDKKTSPYCSTCHHPHGAHQHPSMSGRCALRSCPCKEDTKD